MIEQIKSSEIKKFIEKNPKTVLLDVRTEDEWSTVGKPASDSLGIKTFFITIGQDPSFIESVKKKINKDQGYVAHNISDGFSGNGIDLGWKKEGLPSV